MQKYKAIQFFVYFFILLSFGSSSGSYKIDHLEPPFWWADMVDNRLQILVHGENISELIPELSFPGITVSQVNKIENPNYLFIDLILSKNIQSGEFDILFKRNKKIKARFRYKILDREPNSANRK